MSAATADTMNLVSTKVTAPTPPVGLVPRARLDDVLSAGIGDPGVRVVLVSAPAGSGKSTLVAAWLHTAEATAGWLQADPADHDPARFWSHVVAALGRQLPDLEPAVAPTLPGSGADARPLIERLANHLDQAVEPVTLVVDDYHLIANPDVDNGIEQLVDLAPPNFTLVVCSRVDPSLRLSRLRVRGRLVEIRANDLRFAPAEAAALLDQEGSAPRSHQVAALCERTEGWAAGLVLARMSLADSEDADAFVAAFQGDDRLVVEYLTEEFLGGVSPDDRERLLRTSILERLSGPLIDAVCEITDGGDWLRRLVATNQLLISLDRTGTWFRYHHLLADLLRVEAETSIGSELAELHRRAGRWHRDHGSAMDAIEHYLHSGDHDEAADLIYDEANELLNSGQLATVQRQIAGLGPLADEHIGTTVVSGFLALFAGRLSDARHHLDLARALGPDDDEVRLTTALAVYIAVATGDVATALEEARASDHPTEAAQAMSLIWARTWGGDFDGATALLGAAERLADQQDNTLVAASVPVCEALIALETGRSADAGRAAERALDVAAASGLNETTRVALAHSIIGRTSDDPGEAVAAALRGVELTDETATALTCAYALISAADVVSRHDHPDGHDLLGQARTIVDRCPDPGIVGQYLHRVEARQGTLPAPPDAPGMVEKLTDREHAVLRYLPSQLSQRDIANELYVSLNTVRTHCKAIYRKLGVGDRKAAVQAARDHDLL
ncbi:MAG: LuxR C-terminal-related transcriptional regulator [Actinomycetota bacterium]